MGEDKRVAAKGIVMCEFHRKSWVERLVVKMLTGYNTYDYAKELKRAGFHDVKIEPVPVEYWPDTQKERGLRCIISARA